MAEKESRTDVQGGGVGRAGPWGSADPLLSFGVLFPSFAGTLLGAEEIFMRGFSDSWGSGIFDILRDCTKSSSLDLIWKYSSRISSSSW